MTNQNKSVGISAMAVHFPDQIRTNDYWKENYPDLVASLQKKSSSTRGSLFGGSKNIYWDEFVVNPHRNDPFRGRRETRILAPDETGLDIQVKAAKKVLEASELKIEDIDFIIAVNMVPKGVGLGGLLANKLSSKAPVINLGATCGGGISALMAACAYIKSGFYKRVLVAVACDYSKNIDPETMLGMTAGDGAAAFIVEEKEGVTTLEHFYSVNAADTCNVIYVSEEDNLVTVNEQRKGEVPTFLIEYFQQCTKGILEKSGLTVNEIDFFGIFPPSAGYIAFCAADLGFPVNKAIDIFPHYGNVSPVPAIAILHHAATLGKIQPNNIVMSYTHGFSGTNTALILKWGDNVKLGSMPTGMENQTFEVSDKVLV